jgi:hypothetical protein
LAARADTWGSIYGTFVVHPASRHLSRTHGIAFPLKRGQVGIRRKGSLARCLVGIVSKNLLTARNPPL